MPEPYSKDAYLAQLTASLPNDRQYHSSEQKKGEAINQLGYFVHYINGRILDVLDSRNPAENTYAASYAVYPDEVTNNYPLPVVDPATSVRELREDMGKVEKIKSIAGYRPIEGLRWINKATLRAVTEIIPHKDDRQIELAFGDGRDPIFLAIIPSSVFVELLADPTVTAPKVIQFFQSDSFEIRAESIVNDLLPKIPSDQIKPIIDWIDTIKLPDRHVRKFNALLIRDVLAQRYIRQQTGAVESHDLIESDDSIPEVREFMTDLIDFLDSIKENENGGDFVRLNAGSGDPSPSSSIEPVSDSGTALTSLRSIDAQTGLPARISSDQMERALAKPDTRGALLQYIYGFVHAVPLEKQQQLVGFYDRLSQLANKFKGTDLSEEEFGTSVRMQILSPIQQILRRMYNTIAFQQMLTGTLDHSDKTGNFHVDSMMLAPEHFTHEMSGDLADTLCYSWYSSSGGFPREQYRLAEYIRDLIPMIRAQVVNGEFSRANITRDLPKLEQE